MTFLKFVDHNICCFIPGKVIDEIFSVLRIISNWKEPAKDDKQPRAFEVLQELRDISSMAMEYFDDKIVPGFKVPSPLKYGSAFSAVRMDPNYQVDRSVKSFSLLVIGQLPPTHSKQKYSFKKRIL